MINQKNLIRHEFIGLRVNVVESSNKFVKGITGEVVDETSQTLLIKTDDGYKRVEKANSRFAFMLGDKRVRVDGKRIEMRPENRIKIKVKKW